MTIINLNNLSRNQNLILNKIIKKIKFDYDKLINEVSKNHIDNIHWIVGSIASRNKYQSPLFIRCAQLYFIKDCYNNQNGKISIISNDRCLCKLIKNHYSEISITCNESLPNLIWRKLRPPRQFVISLTLLILRFFSRKKININEFIGKNITIIDTFVINNKSGDDGSIVNGIYKDRYYPGLFENIDNDLKENIYFMPTIIGFLNPYNIFQKIRNCNYNFIVPDDFLKISDYVKAISQPFKLINLKIDNINFHEFSVRDLLIEERLRNSCDFISILGVLYFLFAKRLAKNKIDVRLLIDWYENQVIDRGLIKGFHSFYKDTPVYGYQGYVISRDLHIYSQPNLSEFLGNCVPDKVLVTGKGLKKYIKEFYKDVKVDVAPGFRFGKVFENTNIDFPKTFSVLIGLPIGLSDCKMILKSLLSISKNNKLNFNINFYIKPHPTYTADQMKSLVKDSRIESFNFLNGDFHNSLNKVNLVISNASSICLEALTKKRFVIILAPKSGVLQNPIPSCVSKKIWKIAFDNQELINYIIYFKNLENLKYNKDFEYVKENFFEPVTKEGVLKFLNFEKRK